MRALLYEKNWTVFDLNKTYSRDAFLQFLKNFLPEDFSENLIEYDRKNKLIKNIYELGSVASLDSLSILEIEHSSVNDPKAALTSEAVKVMEGIFIDRCLAVFYCKKDENYRISLINSNYEWVSDYKSKKKYSNPKRYSYFLGADAKIHTPYNKLINNGKVTSLEDLSSRFDIDVVTDEFFESFETLYYKLHEYMSNDNAFSNFISKKDISIDYLAQTTLSRIVFCYFLQKKKLLGAEKDKNIFEGDNNCLMNNFTTICKESKNYYNDFLEYLFYDGLNNEANSADSYVDQIKCRVPFIGGKLFEPIKDYDWKNEFLEIPNHYFSNADGDGIIDVFNQYNFTVDENQSHDLEIGVDPEMLGKILERLLTIDIKKKQATHYTPREIVSYMCQDALATYLKNNLPQDDEIIMILDYLIYLPDSIFIEKEKEIRKNMKESIQKIYYAIGRFNKDSGVLKILDPAVGSGAFPMGMLNLLVQLYKRIDPKLINKTYELKKFILSNMIYGVDNYFGAIEICRLRAWLSLIVDNDASNIEPLPNLDFKFICANTLIPLDVNNQKNLAINSNLESDLLHIQQEYFRTTSTSKMAKLRSKYMSSINQLDIFDDDNRRKLRSYNPFNINLASDFYDTKLHHSVDSFNIVIGNPPYNLEYKAPEAFSNLTSSPYYQGKMNKWFLFACMGIDFLKNKGVLSFIATNNWTTAHGASILRNKIINDTQITKLIDFGSQMIFDQVSQQTMIMTFMKSKRLESYDCPVSTLNRDTKKNIRLSELLSFNIRDNKNFGTEIIKIKRSEFIDKNLTLNDISVEKILKKILNTEILYLNKNEIGQGIVPGTDVLSKKGYEKITHKNNLKIGDPIFVVPNNFFKNLNNEEKKYLKNVIEPNQMKKYVVNEIDKQMIYITKKNFLNDAPNLIEHLRQYREIMDDRRENKKKMLDFYHLHWPRKEMFFNGERILSVRKCKKPTFAYYTKELYVMMSFNIIKTTRIDLKYLTGFFNSSIAAFWFKNKGKMQGNIYQIDGQPLLNIPIPILDHESVNKVIDQVEKITTPNKHDIDSNIQDLEAEIDNIFYEALELDKDDIDLISQSSGV